MNEILRAIDSLLLTSKHNVATPSSWKPGEDVIVDYSLTDAMANMTFDAYRIVDLPSEHVEPDGEPREKHYLRYTKDPSR